MKLNNALFARDVLKIIIQDYELARQFAKATGLSKKDFEKKVDLFYDGVDRLLKENQKDWY